MSEAASLVRLQEIDLKLLRYASTLAAMPQQKKMKTIDLAKRKVASELSKIVGQRKDVEIDIADLEEKLNHYKEKLNHYKEKTLEVQASAATREQNYRNVQDLESQLTSLAKRIEKTEFDLGPLHESLEKLQLAERNARLTADRLDQELTNTRSSYEKDSASIKKQIVELSEERTDVVAGITPAVMATYETTRKRFKGLAVERLVGNVPSVCRVKLQPALYHDLTHGPSIAECPYCHRMIVTEEVDE